MFTKTIELPEPGEAKAVLYYPGSTPSIRGNFVGIWSGIRWSLYMPDAPDGALALYFKPGPESGDYDDCRERLTQVFIAMRDAGFGDEVVSIWGSVWSYCYS